MTQDEIIEMARQAGFMMENSAAIQAAEIFAKLLAAKEREACAKLLKQRTWVGLFNEEIEILFQSAAGADEEVHIRFARAIEAKLKDKNCVG